jgi:hypothetical protein
MARSQDERRPTPAPRGRPGTFTGSSPQQRAAQARRKALEGATSDTIRAWARSKGLAVGKRGKVSKALRKKFVDANGR